jgi:hypothetical protein
VHSVTAQRKAVGNSANELSARPLCGQRRARPGADHSPLVLCRPVDNRSQKGVRRRVAVAFARRAHKMSASACDLVVFQGLDRSGKGRKKRAVAKVRRVAIVPRP